MATTLQQAPNELSLCDDPVILKITAPGSFLSAGVKAQLELVMTGSPSINDTFALTFNGIEQTFTCVASPDGSGRQFRNNAGADPLGDYIEDVIEDLQKNYYLKTYFDITEGLSGSDPTILITAKYYGDEYSLTFDDNITGTAEGTNTAGQSRALNDNHKILVNLLIESEYKSDRFDEIIQIYGSIYESEDSASASSSSPATFPLGEYLKAFFTFPLPDLDQATMVKINENILRFKIEHAEQYGATPVPYEITSPTDVYYAINGGTKHPFRFSYPDINTDWLASNKWLTWEPDGKVLAQTQADFLWFLSLSAQTVYRFVKIYYTDGSSSAWTGVGSLALTKFDVACVPVGYTEIISPLASGAKTVLKWSVKLTSDVGGTTTKAEVRTFYMDQLMAASNRVLHFYNSFGVLCSMLFDWLEDESMVVDAFEYESGAGAQDLATDFQTNAQPMYDDDELTLTTRLISSERIEAIKELFFSPRVYLIEDGQRIPVVITKRALPKSEKDGSGVVAMLKIKRSIKNRHFSA